MPDIRSNVSVLCENLVLNNLDIVDIGSGAGEKVRYMTSQGAHVTGLECGTLQLEKARSYPPEDDEVYVEGFGQEMPFDEEDVLRAATRLRIAPLFAGVRGEPPLDAAAVASVTVAVGRMLADKEAGVRNLDLNPLLVGARGEGCLALDAVVYVEKSRP